MFTGIVEELGCVVARDRTRLRIEAIRVLDDVQLGASIAVNGCCLTVVDWAAPVDNAATNPTPAETGRPVDGAAANPSDAPTTGPADGAASNLEHAGTTGPAEAGTATPIAASGVQADRGGGTDTFNRENGHRAAGWWDADVTSETFDRTVLGSLQPGDPVNLERPVRLQDRLGGHLVQGHVDGVGTIVAAAPDLEVKLAPALMRYVVEKGSITVDGVSLTVVEPKSESFTVAVIPHTADVTTLGTKGVGDTVNLELDVTAKYVEKLLAWTNSEAERFPDPDTEAAT